MDRARWNQIKQGMINDGWRLLYSIHPDMPKDIKDDLVARYNATYPESQFDRKWYYDFKAHNNFFIRLRELPVVEPVDTKHDRFLNHPFYKESSDYRESIKRGQILKGADKYEEPFTPSSWTDQELEDHAMMENVDQEHYIVGLGRRIKELRAALDKMHLIHTALDIHLEHGYKKVKGMEWNNPIRINHERTMGTIQNLLKVGGEVGRIENKPRR